MRRNIKTLLVLALTIVAALPAMAQQTFYLYRNDGVVNQYIISKVKSIGLSKTDLNGKTNDDYVVQEIVTTDSTSRVPLSMVDSISFVPPTPTLKVSKAYVDIDWDKAQMTAADTLKGEYSFTYSGTDPNVKPGSVVVLQADSITSYVVLVTGSTKSGNTYKLQGQLGDLSYLFADTEFSLTTQGQTYGNSSSAAKRYVIGKDLSDKRYTGTIWTNNGTDQQHDLFKNDYVHAYTTSKLAINIDYDVSLRFGDVESYSLLGYSFQHAKDMSFDAHITGDLDAYYNIFVKAQAEKTFDLTPDGSDYKLLKHNLFPPIPIKFTLGKVPINITLGCDLFADAYLKGEGQFDFSAGIGATAYAKVGAKYDLVDNKFTESKVIPYYEGPNLNITRHSPTIEGKGKLTGKAFVFPRIHAWVYGLSGPSFDIKPYISAELSGGFHQDLLSVTRAEDYCSWAFKTNFGLDLAAGYSVSNLDKEIANKTVKDYNVCEYSYKSPVDIKFLKASPNKISRATTTTVQFQVYDQSFNGEKVVTPLPQLVKFSGKGDIDVTAYEYGISKNGIVTAKWTPVSQNDSLYAKIYDPDGNIVASAVFGKEPTANPDDLDVCPDNNHPHLIDLGLGVKWSCCNVGASYPDDYGEYYAWGETKNKDAYDWSTYLNTSDDAATAYNSSWRTPTADELQELKDKCSWVWTTSNRISGVKITGPNGNAIFLPAAGYRWSTETLGDGIYGVYWAKSKDNNQNGSYVSFSADGQNVGGDELDYGHSIRAVAK